MNKFYNKFHNTTAFSKYTLKDFIHMEYDIYSGKIDSTNPVYRAKRTLEKKLCGSKECKCFPMIEIIEIE